MSPGPAGVEAGISNPKTNGCMNSFAPRSQLSHLRHGEAQLGQLDLADQRDGDAVGQHQVAVDEVLDEAVGEAAVMGGEGGGQNEALNY